MIHNHNVVITGGAGYLGGHLLDLLAGKNRVTSIDDFSVGKYKNRKAKLVKADLRSATALKLPKNSIIFHFAANPDVRTSMSQVKKHFDRDVTVTLNSLELARKCDSKQFVFISSSAVYGDAKKLPTPESEKPRPISNYGLFKLFGEELTEFYSANYGIKTTILRLANVIGGRTNHGVVYDFFKKLSKNPTTLEILGDGMQKKSYLYVTDLLSGVVHATEVSTQGNNVFNIGNSDAIRVDEIAKIVETHMNVTPKHRYIDKLRGRGWPGDVKFMLLDSTKLIRTGWKPTISSKRAVVMAIKDLTNQIKQH